MAIIRRRWVLRPRTVMELQPCTSQLAVSGCDQLVVGPTLARGGTLNILMTDVPDLVRVAVVAPIGISLLSVGGILMVLAIPNLCVSKKVFLKHQVNWNTVCGAIQNLPWRTFGLLTILLKF